MLWILFIKVYAVVAAVYLAVTGGYIGWRIWHNKRNPQAAHR